MLTATKNYDRSEKFWELEEYDNAGSNLYIKAINEGILIAEIYEV